MYTSDFKFLYEIVYSKSSKNATTLKNHHVIKSPKVCSQAGCKMGDEGLVQRSLHLLLDLLDHNGLIVLQLRYALKLLLHRLQVLLHLTLIVAHARSVLIQVGRHSDHLELGEAV